MAKKIQIDETLCIGCGTCENIAPEYFKIEDGISVVKKEYDVKDADLISEAIDNCPTGAIKEE